MISPSSLLRIGNIRLCSWNSSHSVTHQTTSRPQLPWWPLTKTECVSGLCSSGVMLISEIIQKLTEDEICACLLHRWLSAVRFMTNTALELFILKLGHWYILLLLVKNAFLMFRSLFIAVAIIHFKALARFSCYEIKMFFRLLQQKVHSGLSGLS